MFAVYYDPWTPYYAIAGIVAIVISLIQLARSYRERKRLLIGVWSFCLIASVFSVATFLFFPPIARVSHVIAAQVARSDDPNQRRAGIEGLCKVLMRRPVYTLERDTAFKTFVDVQATEAIPFLRELLNDSDPDLRRRARAVLDKLESSDESAHR